MNSRPSWKISADCQAVIRGLELSEGLKIETISNHLWFIQSCPCNEAFIKIPMEGVQRGWCRFGEGPESSVTIPCTLSFVSHPSSYSWVIFLFRKPVMDTCICMTEFLCSPPETITFLIEYTPIKGIFFSLKKHVVKYNVSLSYVSCTSKLIEPKEGFMGISEVNWLEVQVRT